jgi:hypothetical protein
VSATSPSVPHGSSKPGIGAGEGALARSSVSVHGCSLSSLGPSPPDRPFPAPTEPKFASRLHAVDLGRCAGGAGSRNSAVPYSRCRHRTPPRRKRHRPLAPLRPCKCPLEATFKDGVTAQSELERLGPGRLGPCNCGRLACHRRSLPRGGGAEKFAPHPYGRYMETRPALPRRVNWVLAGPSFQSLDS